jgi:site-specific recombinase XerD
LGSLGRNLEILLRDRCGQISIEYAMYEFMQDLKRRLRKEATEAKYRLTLGRLLQWCAAQRPPLCLLSELQVPTLRQWLHTLKGASITRHHQHERLITFLYFCAEQGWIEDNPAKRIRNMTVEQVEPVPFTLEQYNAIIEATYHYDRRSKAHEDSPQSYRVRAFIKLLRWSGLCVGDAALLARNKLRDNSLLLYEHKFKRIPLQLLLPSDVADELRDVPLGRSTNRKYFFWSGHSKRKSDVAVWEKAFAKVVSKATQTTPHLFLDRNGRPKPAHMSMLRHTFAVEYLRAGMSVEEVSLLLGHSSVLVTQQRYARWILLPQMRMAAVQREAWVAMIREADL